MDMERRMDDTVSISKYDTSFGTDVTGDLALPDYMPEIKRLLYVSSAVLPENKFLSGNVLELSGTLSYCAVYAGEDGSLSSAPLVEEYSADTALPFSPENTEGIFVDTDIESTSWRATGPRSINIKSRLRFHVVCEEVYENDDAVIGKDGHAADISAGIERLTDEFASAIRRRGSITSSVTGEMRAPDGMRPMTCDGTLAVTTATPDGADVRASGKIVVKCVFAGGGGSNRCVKTEIPFEASVTVGGDLPFSDGRAWGRVASVSVVPADGDDGLYNLNVEYDLEAEAFCRVKATLCTDAYSTLYETENEWRECDIPDVVLYGSKRLDVSGETDLKGESDEQTPLFVAPASCQLSTAVSDGKIWASGAVRARVLVNSAGETVSYEIDIPVKCELGDAPEGMTPQEMQSCVSCSTVDGSARVDKGKLKVDMDLLISYAVSEKKKVKFVSAVTLKDRSESDPVPCIKVYYPERDESVWSICRRYRADRSKLVKNNDFDGDVAAAGKPVIIL